MDPDLRQMLYISLAALAGAISALSFPKFKPLSVRERVMLVFVGFVFAIFVGPLIVGWLLPNAPADDKRVGGLYYLVAVASYWLLPWAIEKATGVKATIENRDAE